MIVCACVACGPRYTEAELDDFRQVVAQAFETIPVERLAAYAADQSGLEDEHRDIFVALNEEVWRDPAFRDYMIDVMSTPEVLDVVSRSPQSSRAEILARIMIAELNASASKGLARLDHEDQIALLRHLESMYVHGSPGQCRALQPRASGQDAAGGTVSMAENAAALPPEEFRAMLDLLQRGLMAEIRGAPSPVEPTRRQSRAGREALEESLEREFARQPDPEAAIKALADPANAPGELVCSSMALLYRAMIDLPEPERTWLVRAMTGVMARR